MPKDTVSHTAQNTGIIRCSLLVQGQVQGVGFRPFVYRLAHDLSLTGSVGNTSEGVVIEIQGAREHVQEFPHLLKENLPPLARLTNLTVTPMPCADGEENFTIVMSHGHHGHNVLISPDVGLCADCERDMHEKGNRRYSYAFTNCTNCGPRYTITHSIPYDRAVTSMACFPMCPECAKEYTDPLNRRFHAQPIACPVCGPKLWLVSHADAMEGRTKPSKENIAQAVDHACQSLLEGRILAVRGLGGFQLACDARNDAVIKLLRHRKRRPDKAFALMAPSLDVIRSFCCVSAKEAELLSSPMRPAVVLEALPNSLPASLAPDLSSLACMLPTTPLHVVLFDTLSMLCRSQGRPAPVLVMTSGNLSGDPICLGNREALDRLIDIADDFLLHDRDILCRVDDSVVLCPKECGSKDDAFFLRRARGYVPSAIELKESSETSVFAAGSDLKAACCITRGSDAFPGQHIGDLEHPAAAAFYDEAAAHLLSLLEVKPGLVVCDCHPDFYSSRMAREFAGRHNIPLMTLQHHAAHAASVLAEHHVASQALVLVLDGFGYGLDGTAWGGELIRMDLSRAHWTRAGHFLPFALPGGDAAVKSPWRLALSLACGMQDKALAAEVLSNWQKSKGREADFLLQMLQKSLNCPLSSSCGRLFDAVSAQLKVCEAVTYEGQAAIRLESLAQKADGAALPETSSSILKTVSKDEDGSLLLDGFALFERVCRLQKDGLDAALTAYDFHVQLAQSLVRLVLEAHCAEDGNRIGLSGGVLNNSLLRKLLAEQFARQGFTVLLSAKVPAGDGGISLGQAAFGLASLRCGKLSDDASDDAQN